MYRGANLTKQRSQRQQQGTALVSQTDQQGYVEEACLSKMSWMRTLSKCSGHQAGESGTVGQVKRAWGLGRGVRQPGRLCL